MMMRRLKDRRKYCLKYRYLKRRIKKLERKSGVLMHISSLPGEYSCGAFNESAKKFVDFIKECGFSYWQVLPFGIVDECNSPYKSYSAFAGNPYFIDIEALNRNGLITHDELEAQKQTTPYSCEYVRLYHSRLNLLRKAAKRAANKDEITEFIAENKYLDKFCTFMGLKAVNENLPWQEWKNDVPDEDEVFAWKFIQYYFFTQWKEIKAYANDKGIEIIGDIPIYVSPDSADVWAEREQFLLDEKGYPEMVAGVPPDYFAKDGQLWGNPIYDWNHMERDGFSWWGDRMCHMLDMFDGVRIDHFRGVESYWGVPASEETAKNGKWYKGPGMKLVEKIHEVAGDKLVIAEDLGDITEDVYKLLEESGFPGMRVFQFAFLGDDNTPHLPHNYKNNCIAYSGTHDNNTLLGYLWELDNEMRRKMLEYCGYLSSDWERGYDSILRTLFASHAGVLILPIQDLLGYGSDTRMNIPGTAHGNWQFRITEEQLRGIDKEKFKRFNALYKR